MAKICKRLGEGPESSHTISCGFFVGFEYWGVGEKKPLAKVARKFHAQAPETHVKFTSPSAG
ncbi:hypothetical protein BU251_00775 [Candidatus Velamenicoccus archaeovorus]|uniref:Uncharacterized protein n=1 Tax=Velamenicoccus archaeovorus TaxID=1930593 RepID=A0A410P2G6_VELA1|nr:hypothetical protein BU251_00775 [Candidatus Velamenicoccus archaeovorus]